MATATPAGEYDGGILVPTNGASITTPSGYAPTLDDFNIEQIDEINASNSVVLGMRPNDQVSVIPDAPLYENEAPIRKRLVKIVNGKIVESRIAYIRRQAVSTSKGAQYVFLYPEVDPLSNVVTYYPMNITLL